MCDTTSSKISIGRAPSVTPKGMAPAGAELVSFPISTDIQGPDTRSQRTVTGGLEVRGITRTGIKLSILDSATQPTY